MLAAPRHPPLGRGLAIVVALLVATLARADAERPVPALPSGIPADERARLQEIADRAAVATQVETEPFLARPAVFEYLLDHPEFATHVTRALRFARYRIWQTPQGLFLDDGWGVTGHFWLAYAASGVRVMRARGEYSQTFMPTIRGDAVTMIAYALAPAEDGKSLVRATVTGYVRLDSRMLATVIKVAPGIAQRKADLEARRLVRVFARVSRAVEDDPGGVLDKVGARPDVPRRELEEFARLLRPR
ncbi:MAG: hypothetical protein HY294_16050 [Candidatus Rokubacteria bacterium]|nr:hypothetical protein [Candidatus Rokubacteria bacterium]MBI3827505.1 hypothetical protein [Candidatus Rokubacteria bacterium]